MKAPQFWYRPASLLAQFMAPLGYIYFAGSVVRSLLARRYKASIPMICVGNVVAGGSGKTPTALALAALLQKNGKKPAFVTRGYGGAQKGPLRVDGAHHSSIDVGDEAMLLLRQAPAWIGRNRVKAIREAERFASHIILDDGLQNPHIRPDLSLLVIDATAGFGNGRMIPAGPLREPLQQALKRVQAIVAIGDGKIESFGKPVFRAHLKPNIPENFPQDAKFLAFAGIGRPQKFYEVCRGAKLNLVATEDFADHHRFRLGELETLEKKARSLGAKLLTTEKDYVRLPDSFRKRVTTFPVQLVFEDAEAVEKLLLSITK